MHSKNEREVQTSHRRLSAHTLSLVHHPRAPGGYICTDRTRRSHPNPTVYAEVVLGGVGSADLDKPFLPPSLFTFFWGVVRIQTAVFNLLPHASFIADPEKASRD